MKKIKSMKAEANTTTNSSLVQNMIRTQSEEKLKGKLPGTK